MPELLDRLRAALADRYAIERELGRGGMATVYLARDLKHERSVAVKVVRAELAAVLGPDRFLREIKLTARLNHPHILPLLDSGEAGGFLYYVMPYVEGESLRDRLNREKQLPIEDALQIAREVADALDYAHRHDVVHRDIKPENILLEERHAVVADFGIAKAIKVAGGEKLTATGVTVGTPEYMSPEQAGGQGHLDGRSDVYALGCVLYEMLAGRPPFLGPTVESLVHQHLTAPPPALTDMRAAVPTRVAKAIEQCLAKAPADRYSTASQFAQALTREQPAAAASRRRPVIAAAIAGALVVAGLGAYLALHPGAASSGGAGAGVPRLAVLPFENLGAPVDEYFADGITDEITSRLAKLSGLSVIDRMSAMQYKKTTKPVREIGKELGVEYVLEGSVRWSKTPQDSYVRVTPELVRVSDGTQMWAEPYEQVLADIFKLQAGIAERVAEALNVTLLAQEREAVETRPTENLEAYDYYLRGNDYFSRRLAAPDARRAVQMYERAVQLDPSFGDAWAHLAWARIWLAWDFGDDLNEARAAARAALDQAVKFAPDRILTHMALGYFYYYGSSDYANALKEFATALRTGPNNAEVVNAIGSLLRRQGYFEEALARYRQAQALNPRDAQVFYNAGQASLVLRRYDDAEGFFDRAIAIAPTVANSYANKINLALSRDGNTATAWRVLADAASQADTAAPELLNSRLRLQYLDRKFDDALHSLSLDPRPGRPGWYWWQARIRVAAGQRRIASAYADSLRRIQESAIAQRPSGAGVHADLGFALAILGRSEEAIREGKRAVELTSSDLYTRPFQTMSLAQIYLLVGQTDAALEQLGASLAASGYYGFPPRLDPIWDPLRKDPRFEALLAKYDPPRR